MKRLKRWNRHTLIFEVPVDLIEQVITRGVKKHIRFVRLFENGELHIHKGYRWNGCSPKWEFFSMIFGTPEGAIGPDGFPMTWGASMVHDVLYQMKVGTRKDADLQFYKMLKERGFRPARLYYWVVRLFGGKAWRE